LIGQIDEKLNRISELNELSIEQEAKIFKLINENRYKQETIDKLNSTINELDYLSQARQEEIENIRKQHFAPDNLILPF